MRAPFADTALARTFQTFLRRLRLLALLGGLGAGVGLLHGAVQPEEQSTARGEFEFREPARRVYRVTLPQRDRLDASSAPADWLDAQPTTGSAARVQLGRRILIQVEPWVVLGPLIDGRPIRAARDLGEQTHILEADDVPTALREAQDLAVQPGVLVCRPVLRRLSRKNGVYAPAPDDPYFARTWHLENRNQTSGAAIGADLNVRGAWSTSRGAGVLVAMGDDGVEVTHPDLRDRASGAPHFNFTNGQSNGLPVSTFQLHGTAVAGLIAASADNKRGSAGVAPNARLASWVVFNRNDFLASEEQLFDMFQFQSNVVAIQNHSWGNAGIEQLRPALLERRALSNAHQFGRGGLGVVMVRSGGNGRENGSNANDDGYPSDPIAIGVAAVRSDGRVATYSSPGVSLLVAAPSGDDTEGFANLFTTDRQGSLGYNTSSPTSDLSDYGFETTGFSGTSGAAPLIAGLSALILGTNPDLHVRDVQQILIHSARHYDLADPLLATNAAGFGVSPNVGFGVPDAGVAVTLAQRWIRRPPLEQFTFTSTNPVALPDGGLRVVFSTASALLPFASVPAAPGMGLHPDDPTPLLPLVDIGSATETIGTNLSGKAALIQRGSNLFREKLARAAEAGAAFAVVYNNRDGDELTTMGGTEFVTIPALFIGQNHGETLRTVLQGGDTVLARLSVQSTNHVFVVTNTLACEHVGVRIRTDHQSRGDVRVLLYSPAGTKSELQRLNSDTHSDLLDWTYWSTAHFYESSAGTWRVVLADERETVLGTVEELQLIVRGVPIADLDRDGLDDAWEERHFGGLKFGAAEDPDHDGYSNAREQVLGTDPFANQTLFEASITLWNSTRLRLEWPAVPGRRYEIQAATNPVGPFTRRTLLNGRWPQSEWLGEVDPSSGPAFFRLLSGPDPSF